MTTTIYKNLSQKKVSGVCAGIGHHFGVPANLVRVGAIVLAFSAPMITIVAYGVATALMPNRR